MRVSGIFTHHRYTIGLLACLGLLLIGGCSQESAPSPKEKEDVLRWSKALSSMRQKEEEIARLTTEIHRHQDAAVGQSNALAAVQNELKEERESRAQLEANTRSEARAREDAAAKEVKRQLAGLMLPAGSDAHFPGFRPKLLNGCLVDSTEFAWAQDAANRLPKESKPKILIVNHLSGKTVVSHAFCTFKTPRGTWFAYNPTRGSQQLFSSQVPNAKEWGEELVPAATSSWLEERK